MTLLKKASNHTAFLKIGILGFQGSGKTFTASRLVAGALKHQNIKNPKVTMFDTEKSSDFLVDFFEKQGIEFFAVKSRSFQDLLNSIKESEEMGVHAMIVDSVSHVWRELMKAFQIKFKRKNGLLMQDWGVVKGEWNQFTDLFINSKMHFISLGRAGYEYDETTNEETGKKSLIKTGVKMKAEGEFGYESDLLLEMEKVQNLETNTMTHRCWVLKDRWDILDGKHFDNPTFQNFLPIVNKLNLGGEHYGVDTTRSSEAMFDSPDTSHYERQRQRDIALETLQEVLILANLDGTSTQAKEGRTKLLIEIFGTSSKTAIENLFPEQIRAGVAEIKQKLWPEQKVNVDEVLASSGIVTKGQPNDLL